MNSAYGLLPAIVLLGFLIGRLMSITSDHRRRITELEAWTRKNGEPEK